MITPEKKFSLMKKILDSKLDPETKHALTSRIMEPFNDESKLKEIEAEFNAATSSEQKNQQTKSFDRFFEESGDSPLEILYKNMGDCKNQNDLLVKILASSLNEETKSNFAKRLILAGNHMMQILRIETEFNAAASSERLKKERESAEAFSDRFSKFMGENRKLGIPSGTENTNEKKQPTLAEMIMTLLRGLGEKEDLDSKAKDGYHFAIKTFRPFINLAPMMAKHIARDLVPIVNAFLVLKNEIYGTEEIKRTLEESSKIKAVHYLTIMHAYQEAGFSKEEAFALLATRITGIGKKTEKNKSTRHSE